MDLQEFYNPVFKRGAIKANTLKTKASRAQNSNFFLCHYDRVVMLYSVFERKSRLDFSYRS